jgi:hypothetical protein
MTSEEFKKYSKKQPKATLCVAMVAIAEPLQSLTAIRGQDLHRRLSDPDATKDARRSESVLPFNGEQLSGARPHLAFNPSK